MIVLVMDMMVETKEMEMMAETKEMLIISVVMILQTVRKAQKKDDRKEYDVLFGSVVCLTIGDWLCISKHTLL